MPEALFFFFFSGKNIWCHRSSTCFLVLLSPLHAITRVRAHWGSFTVRRASHCWFPLRLPWPGAYRDSGSHRFPFKLLTFFPSTIICLSLSCFPGTMGILVINLDRRNRQFINIAGTNTGYQSCPRSGYSIHTAVVARACLRCIMVHN